MVKTIDEKSRNDSYLIVKRDGMILKKSYRKNLISEIGEMDKDLYAQIAKTIVYDLKQFREIVRMADEYGYEIYQLTQL